MPFEFIAYKCGHCRYSQELFRSAKAVRQHEKTCPWNPEVQACLTCRHHRKETVAMGSKSETNDVCGQRVPIYEFPRVFCSKWEVKYHPQDLSLMTWQTTMTGLEGFTLMVNEARHAD
jgi:hypothetical protein